MDDKLLLVSLNRFYSSKNNLEEISSIILGTSKLSLRLIDWYVTTHCKRHNIVYILNNNEYFNVYLNYRSQLKAFKKTQFDPFRRRERISFCVDNKNSTDARLSIGGCVAEETATPVKPPYAAALSPL